MTLRLGLDTKSKYLQLLLLEVTMGRRKRLNYCFIVKYNIWIRAIPNCNLLSSETHTYK